VAACCLFLQNRQEVQQQLNMLQQEVADLQVRLDDLAEGNTNSKNQQQHLQPQQQQELEQKIKQGNDELAEQVLQLDLQLQMVSDLVPSCCCYLQLQEEASLSHLHSSLQCIGLCAHLGVNSCGALNSTTHLHGFAGG
jgi:chromosome segregation ATPase